MEKSREREPWEVEKYFGVSLEAFDENSYEYQVMMRIQCDYDNDTIGKDISYYASLYGF